MTKILLTAAALGLAVSSASACDMMRSAKASEAKGTVAASVPVQSEPQQTASAETTAKTSDAATQ